MNLTRRDNGDPAGPTVPRAPVDELLVLTAHPDDERIFFAGWVQALQPRRLVVCCATGDFGPSTTTRRAELRASAADWGAEVVQLDLLDVIDVALPSAGLDAGYRALSIGPDALVLSHGPLGDYGHRHHGDVFRAAWRVFGERLWCLAGPLAVHATVELSAAELEAKRAAVRAFYPSQTSVVGFAGETEAICHVASSEFADPAGPQRFVERLLTAYFTEWDALPTEARTVREHWPSPVMEGHLRARALEWLDEHTAAWDPRERETLRTRVGRLPLPPQLESVDRQPVPPRFVSGL